MEFFGKGSIAKFSRMFFVVLILSSLALSGCSTAKGTDMEERGAVLQAARDFGFIFDDTLISTLYGTSNSQVILEGPMGGPKFLEAAEIDKAIKAEYSKVVFDLIDGEWVFNSAVQK